MVVIAVIAMMIIAAGAYAASVIIASVKEQQRLTELELQRAEQEAEAERERAEALAEAAAQAEEEAEEVAKDTDSDGLTDIEELLYGTNFREPDSDKDSYLDGNEVFHRYHPLGDAPATLLDTGAVKVFEDALYPFTMYYPSSWSTSLDETNMTVAFRSSRQASITVEWEEKPADETLADWYDASHTDRASGDLKEILTKEGYYGLTTADDRTAYLDFGGDAVITLTYDLGSRTQVEYLQTFQMMVNSLTMVEDVVTPEETTTP
ncbi:hypothetical protein HYS28_03935 [Candidatus Uhrbacteria bacterium]|nr:hypothetical protein [Candidatus Uhrbacteria bacterium]